MPVTAKLSKAFYDRLGEQIANELVEWFNQVDATYRSDLREVNELNFARFDAKLEQRVAQVEAKIDRRFAQVEAKAEHRFAQLDVKIDRVAAELTATLERRLGEQTRWYIVAWAAVLASNIGLWFR
ncbi:MAG: hypothetical protein M3373_03425 [Gemmatimonadota bacterium]|nr:hypothetical protein [Gemmatimonadota bacterium]